VPVVLRPCGHLHDYSLRRSALRKRVYLAIGGRMVRRACTAWHYTSANESAHSWPGDESPRFVLPNGIEPALYDIDRAEARAAVGHAWPQLGVAPYVLFLGRLHPKKRLDLLLEAFLRGAAPGVKLVVAGPDECDLWPALVCRFLSSAAAERVLRVGTVSGRDKVTLLAAARLFVLPSEHENFGVAALEALACGTPVLLSPHVDLAAAAFAEEAVHVAPLELDAWGERLAALSAGDGDSEASDRARHLVAEQFGWGRLAQELEGHYRWILAGCRERSQEDTRTQELAKGVP